ncbi:hydrolase 2, exosortase A system-associated [Thiohalorhabdus methylotrophus]|uniref:Hydrolase 2, exosortase A system-associated n=1 Tax=Thiohalorhabdus methylotrophus TaxID=3242694 RepID=A0ABV4TWK5_9GAMM
MRAPMITPFFLDSAGGRIFCTAFHSGPRPGPGPGLLFLPPWAEEANKARRMMARLGHALAESGFTTLVPDLFGTGDSHGDFSEARWPIWLRNAADARAWLREWCGGPVYAGGLRLGALLALEAARDFKDPPAGFLLWSPVTNGQQALKQFLRLRLAAGMGMGGDQVRETTRELQDRLDAGETLEVAGYELHPELAGALADRSLKDLPPPKGADVHWLDLVSGPDAGPPPASRTVVEAWSAQDAHVHQETVAGEHFWATQELVDVPDLIESSRDTLAGYDNAEPSAPIL